MPPRRAAKAITLRTAGKLSLALLAPALLFGCGRQAGDTSSPPNRSASDAGGRARETAAIVQADVRRDLTAIYAGDVATVLQYTSPTIIEELGGASQAGPALQKILDQIQAAEMKIESLNFPEPPVLTNSAARDFAIVPTLLLISSKGQRVESLNYQFGAKPRGQTNWTYIEGSRINADNVRTMFPDFPAGVAFPKTYRKKVSP